MFTYTVSQALRSTPARMRSSGRSRATGNYTPASHTAAAVVINQGGHDRDGDNKSSCSEPPLPVFTASFAGFMSGDGPHRLAAACSSRPGRGGEHGWHDAITPGGVTSGNYAVTFVAGSLNITYDVCLGYDPARRTTAAAPSPNQAAAVRCIRARPGSPSIVITPRSCFASRTQAGSEVETPAETDRMSTSGSPASAYCSTSTRRGLTTGRTAGLHSDGRSQNRTRCSSRSGERSFVAGTAEAVPYIEVGRAL